MRNADISAELLHILSAAFLFLKTYVDFTRFVHVILFRHIPVRSAIFACMYV